MNMRRILVTAGCSLILGTPAFAESGNFVVRLGQDTTSIETYDRTPKRLEIHQVGRSPRVLRRHFIYDYDKGNVAKISMVVTAPGSETPTQTITGTFSGTDSSRMKIETANQPVQNVSVMVPAGAVVVANSSPWAGYEGALQKLMKGKSDSLRTSVYFIGGTDVHWLSLRKEGADRVAIVNQRGDMYRARVDKTGKLLAVEPTGGTQRVSVDRVDGFNMNALTESFAARDKAGAGIGTLSPRDSVNATAAGAAIWIDYSRPGKRGRDIMGAVVPYGEVWRTGANAATQFKTDKALDFGGTVIPAGFYTLFSVPNANGWKLMFNSETGQPGTAYKKEKDIATVDMKVEALPEVVERFTIGVDPTADGGVLRLDWDKTRASVPFRVVTP